MYLYFILSVNIVMITYAHLIHIPLFFVSMLVLSAYFLLLRLDVTPAKIWQSTVIYVTKLARVTYDRRKVRKNHFPLNVTHTCKREGTTIGRHKFGLKRKCPSYEIKKTGTQVKYIEDRPFVQGTLAGCLTTDILVDYGASTSVISSTHRHEHEYQRVWRT